MRVVLAVVVLLATPGAAAAATLERSGGLIRFTGGAEDNYVNGGKSFFPDGWSVTSREGLFGAAIPPDLSAAPGCTNPSSGNETTCSLAPAVARWELFGNSGNDILNYYYAPGLIEGGEGNDQMEAGDQDDILRGGPGDEIWLKGRNGDDVLDGGGGNDRLYPGEGADQVIGGDGTDEVTYQENDSTEPVTVTLDGVADDGESGALANVQPDVEDAVGGDGNDFLRGDADRNVLRGELPGVQDGNDILDGGGGPDVLIGGLGNDTIRARDGVADQVDCGDGTDKATVDTIDVVVGCETVDASAELEPDRDADGVAAPADCDDRNAAIGPFAVDVPENGIDEDCTGGDAQVLDRDGDGAPRPADCDDANPAARPGLTEVLGNAVDEDCSGRADPFPRLGAEITSRWTRSAAGTTAVRLQVRGAPKGTRVTLRCTGGGCPRGVKSVRVKRARKPVSLLRFLRGRRLQPGAVVDVRARTDATIGVAARFAVRGSKLPKRTSLCLPPGAAKPAAC